MQLEEYIKYLEAAGYNISVRYDIILDDMIITVRRGNYQISGYIYKLNLSTYQEDKRNIIILDFIKEKVKELDTQINDFLEETFYKK